MAIGDSPFDLKNAVAYAAWRERKLDSAPRRIEDIVDIALAGKGHVSFED